MRELKSHTTNPANEAIKIVVGDEPSHTGANHRYEITGFDTETNPSKESVDGYSHSKSRDVILFQNGAIPDVGVNGITHEVFLAILIDRVEGFQRGPFACRENAIALTKMQEALMWFQKRTLDRMARGVEGQHIK